MLLITEDNGDFLVGLFERVRLVAPWEDDQRSVKGRSEPRDMSMPKESASLTCDGEVICV